MLYFLIDSFIYSFIHLILIFSFSTAIETGSEETDQSSNKGPFIILGIIFVSALIAMTFVYTSFPELQP